MPRPNRTRSIASEDNLARRVAYEREQRGWSYAGLAQRMTAQGCAIDQSALYKIEKGTPRRRISVDELVALSEVFAIPVADMLAPPELMAQRQVLDVLERFRQAKAELRAAQDALYGLLDGDEHVRIALAEHLTIADVPPMAYYKPSGRTVIVSETYGQDLGVKIIDAMIGKARADGDPAREQILSEFRADMARADGEHPEAP
jgi:transcriptional regulator with XRE-family HTH domain